MGVTMTMPEGHAIWDCGAALDCIGEAAAARTAQLGPSPRLEKNTSCSCGQDTAFRAGCDGDRVEASFVVTWPVQIGDTKTWIEAFVLPGITPMLISRRWLSQHRSLVNFYPNNLCLEIPAFGSFLLVLHSSGPLLLSLVVPSNTLDQYTVMTDYQNNSSGFVSSEVR